MNPFGSYKRLRDNSIAAMVGAIEIYNKPRFAYRDECSVILMINAWELLLKATLSKNRVSIYYPKRRGEPYRTLGWTDALRKVKRDGHWPASLNQHAVTLNIDSLAEYRDNAVHFYNASDFGVVIHSLAQQSLINYRDYLRAVFGKELADEITWALMPLGTTPPVDPITYLRGSKGAKAPSAAVREFLDSLEGNVAFLQSVGEDASRLMTQLPVTLISAKKAKNADAVVAVDGLAGAKAIVKRVDPNMSHPLTATQVVSKIATDSVGRPFTSNTFYAIAEHKGLRTNDAYFYKPKTGSPQWSEEVVAMIKKLPASEIDAALQARRDRIRSARSSPTP